MGMDAYGRGAGKTKCSKIIQLSIIKLTPTSSLIFTAGGYGAMVGGYQGGMMGYDAYGAPMDQHGAHYGGYGQGWGGQ